MSEAVASSQPMSLQDGSRIAVIGGGPAGSFFSFFLLETASRVGLDLRVDIFETKDYTKPGPGGCNMCGGIISESLVQILATEGINLPSSVVQRGIDSYHMHMDVGSVRIDTPRHEKRIAAVHRGAGPRGLTVQRWGSFDGHLLDLAKARGANVIREKVDDVVWVEGKPCLKSKLGQSEPYDLLAVASGVNSGAMRLLEKLGCGYTPPKITKTAICEFNLGAENIEACLGSAMHVFLLNLPRLEFAALIPKGEYVTAVLLGEEVDKELTLAFLNSPEVKACFPPGWTVPADHCRCFPSINVRGAPQPFADRLVVIGDCGESRLYKDGIGGAYRTAKAAAKTAVFEGVSAENFRRHFMPVCRDLAIDNAVGKLIFGFTGVIQALRFTRKGILRLVAKEQTVDGNRRMSGVLWDMFTGSAPYRDVFRRTLHPLFSISLVWEIFMGFFSKTQQGATGRVQVSVGDLGRVYRTGEVIVRQGDTGDCMYVIQAGQVEVVKEDGGREVSLAVLGEGDYFGEMAIFEKDVRSATVRPLGEVRVLTIDRKMFLQKIHQDPSLAFRIMQKMSHRIRELNEELVKSTRGQPADAALGASTD